MDEKPPPKGVTRHLNMNDMPTAPPKISTRPLEYIMPWVIELRVVGTPSVIQIRVTDTMVLGRSDPEQEMRPDIELESYSAYMLGVSRQHARLIAEKGRVVVQDLGSANGTYLNEGRLEPGKRYPLHHGDRLKLGRLELQVLFVIMPSSQEEEQERPPAGTAEVPKIGSGQHVWVVDDDEHVAQTIRDVLTEVGFRVTVMDKVTDAMFRLAKEKPDAIVLELMLQDRSGLDLIHSVRSREGGEALPLVVVSSSVAGYQMNQAMEAGVNLFLRKPVGLDDLLTGFSQIFPQARR